MRPTLKRRERLPNTDGRVLSRRLRRNCAVGLGCAINSFVRRIKKGCDTRPATRHFYSGSDCDHARSRSDGVEMITGNPGGGHRAKAMVLLIVIRRCKADAVAEH